MKDYELLALYIKAEEEKDLEGLKVYGKELKLKGYTRTSIEKIKPEIKLYEAIIANIS